MIVHHRSSRVYLFCVCWDFLSLHIYYIHHPPPPFFSQHISSSEFFHWEKQDVVSVYERSPLTLGPSDADLSVVLMDKSSPERGKKRGVWWGERWGRMKKKKKRFDRWGREIYMTMVIQRARNNTGEKNGGISCWRTSCQLKGGRGRRFLGARPLLYPGELGREAIFFLPLPPLSLCVIITTITLLHDYFMTFVSVNSQPSWVYITVQPEPEAGNLDFLLYTC